MSNLDQIKVARIILDMGISYTELKKAENKWNKHKKVISSDYHNNKDKYWSRIKKIIDECLKQEIDIVIFPACTFLYDNKKEFNHYRSIVEKVEWVLSGALEIKDNSFNENSFNEIGVVLKKGEIFEKIDGNDVLGVDLDGISSRIALSSTIRKIRDGEIITSKVSPLSQNENNIFAFDLGHHQYTGRYKMTLESITRILSEEANVGAAIFLSYWKYIHGTSNYYWYETDDNIDINMNRKKLQVIDSNKVDYLDVFKINLLGRVTDEEPKLIKNLAEVKENMIRFKKALENENNDIIRKLSNFKKWYYNEKEDVFAPSKFIGYKNMTGNKYEQLSTIVMDGRNTEKVLHSLSVKLKDENKEDTLKQELQSLLNKYDKKLNRVVTIRIIK